MSFRPPPSRSAVLAAVLTFCVAAGAHADAHSALSVRLHAAAKVADPAVVLGDVAEVTGADRQQTERLRSLPLGRVNSGTKATVLQRADIVHWACMKCSLCGTQVAWSGAQQITIRAVVQVAASTGPAEVARQELERALAPLGARLSLEVAAASRSVDLPPGVVAYTARPLPVGAAPSRHMSVWVDATVNGHFVRAVPVQFKVSALVPAWVAKDDIPAGSRVGAEAFTADEVDLTEMAGVTPRLRAYTFTVAGAALRVLYPLHCGQILSTANSGPVPLVARGESALLRVITSPIELERRVEVLQDGFLGQIVKVRAKNAGGTLLAKVAGAGLLEAQN